MRCPFCSFEQDRVLDTRTAPGGRAIRRRRECLKCGRRFTTYEQIEELQLVVVKKDLRRQPFDRSKILSGLKAACQKRPVSTATLEAITDDIERTLYNQFRREVPAAEIGEMVVERLSGLDPVAYVRFASVYRAFKDLGQFQELVEALGKPPAFPPGTAGEPDEPEKPAQSEAPEEARAAEETTNPGESANAEAGDKGSTDVGKSRDAGKSGKSRKTTKTGESAKSGKPEKSREPRKRGESKKHEEPGL